MFTMRNEPLDRDVLLRRLQELVAVFQEDSAGMVPDFSEHRPWLPEAKAERTWEFWDRYREYSEDVLLLPPRVVGTLDRSTEGILGDLEDPLRPGPWRRTGLVIGQVQSGKTGNYTGLACKAADAGYKLIIILAGIHNDLRSQTQLRIDQGLLGFDSQHQKRYDDKTRKRPIGVGRLPLVKKPGIGSFTDSSENGDFHRAVAQRSNIPIGHFPIVLVIKKHRSIIGNVRRWLVDVTDSRDGTVRDIPLLLIDDEADNASIDVSKDDETNPSKVNGEIRQLLRSFDRAAYVGYTATPFANVLIDPAAESDEFGKDLFPASFIRSLPAPSNYLGPERVFGLRSDDPDDEDIEPLPIVRLLDDSAGWIPQKHRSSWQIAADLPASLKQAVRAFVLTCAARRARGHQNQHNSMLVHVTRFTDVQQQVTEQIDDHVRLLVGSLRDRHGQSSTTVLQELRALWEEDFVRTTSAFPADEAIRLTWQEISGHILPAAQKIHVRAVNGTAKDALEYYEHRNTGLSVIAVGGEKLSRGLTLEGLSISYYLRSARAVDTLLQMGRWFGYRPGYEDLCRLYTTVELRDAYVEITRTTDSLRREVEEMAALGESPERFGLKIASSSVGLTPTAPAKMRNSKKIKFSFSGEAPETVMFDLNEVPLGQNLKSLETLVARLDARAPARPERQSLVWSDVPPDDVIEFLEDYHADSGAYRVRPNLIARYIRSCAQADELRHWTVRLVGKENADATASIAGHDIGLITRAATNDPKNEGRQTIRRVLNPPDESTDLDEEQKQQALKDTRKASEGKLDKNGNPRDPRIPTGLPLRRVRRRDQALLLLYPLVPPEHLDQGTPLVGFAISFPESPGKVQTEYVVNEVWRREQIDLDEENDS
ncbi:Z1 domain-containing protein [Actinomadura gamaensis]|uniref:Z1 domain-containing protein n=1 Tax=Actinomadura gamaensis TaxID=1763541 RepID=A0ABV9UFQ8_9ACTN